MSIEQALIAFTFAAALLVIAPGPDTALVLRTAMFEGARRAMLVGLGIAAGCMTWGLVVAVGLGALIAASELAYTLLKWIGAAYLVFLGLTMIFARDKAAAVATVPRPRSGWIALRRGYLTNLLNPKVGAFYVSFLPQFIPEGVDILAMTLALAAIQAVLGLVWFALVVTALKPVMHVLGGPAVKRWIDRVVGGVLIAFGARLALESRSS